jgi:hypothetical protein
MKKILLLFAFGFLCQLSAEASIKAGQPDISKDSVSRIGLSQRTGFGEKKNTVWVNIGQLATSELQISFERETMPNVAIEGTIGFKAPRNLGQPYNLSVRSIGPQNYYDYIALIPFSTGIMAGLAVKKYFNPEQDIYLSGGFFYRYWLYNHQHLNSSEMDSQGSNNFSSKQSLRMHVSGFKLLAGFIIGKFNFTPNTNMVVDLYTGLGYRKKLVSTVYDPHIVLPADASEPAPELNRSENVTLQLGLKVGLNF